MVLLSPLHSSYHRGGAGCQQHRRRRGRAAPRDKGTGLRADPHAPSPEGSGCGEPPPPHVRHARAPSRTETFWLPEGEYLKSGGGGVGTRPRYSLVCLWRRLLASRLLILTVCGSERVFVVSREPPDDLSRLTTPGVGCPGDGLLPVPLTGRIPMHTPSPCGGLPTPALTCARWGVHLQDNFPDRGF